MWWVQALRKEKAVAALIPIMIGGSVGGREAAAVALANLAAGNRDTAVRITATPCRTSSWSISESKHHIAHKYVRGL